MSDKKAPLLHVVIIVLFSAALAIIGTDDLHNRFLKGEFRKDKQSQAATVVNAFRDDTTFKLSESRAQYKDSDENLSDQDKSWLDYIVGNSDQDKKE